MYRHVLKYCFAWVLAIVLFVAFGIVGYNWTCDAVYKRLTFNYGFPFLTENELKVVERMRAQEYQKGDYSLFNWVAYNVQKKNNTYEIYMYPDREDGFSWKFFMFAVTKGRCCGGRKMIIDAE